MAGLTGGEGRYGMRGAGRGWLSFQGLARGGLANWSADKYPMKESELYRQISGPLNVEVDDVDLIAGWCRDTDPTPVQRVAVRQFQEELRRALDRPGTVTPELYEAWSDDCCYVTQSAVQDRLQEIWDACFG